jgi:hypothetical protein
MATTTTYQLSTDPVTGETTLTATTVDSGTARQCKRAAATATAGIPGDRSVVVGSQDDGNDGGSVATREAVKE